MQPWTLHAVTWGDPWPLLEGGEGRDMEGSLWAAVLGSGLEERELQKFLERNELGVQALEVF